MFSGSNCSEGVLLDRSFNQRFEGRFYVSHLVITLLRRFLTTGDRICSPNCISSRTVINDLGRRNPKATMSFPRNFFTLTQWRSPEKLRSPC